MVQPHLDPIPSNFRRVIDIFDDDGNGEVDFKEFIMGLSHFRFFTTTAMMDENVKQHIGFYLPPTRCPIEDASLLVSTKPAISPPRQLGRKITKTILSPLSGHNESFFSVCPKRIFSPQRQRRHREQVEVCIQV